MKLTDDVFHFVQEPPVDTGQFVEAVNGVSSLQGGGQDEHPLVCWLLQLLKRAGCNCNNTKMISKSCIHLLLVISKDIKTSDLGNYAVAITSQKIIMSKWYTK